MGLDHALDRLAYAMATSRNRRGLFALGGAVAAVAAGPAGSVVASTAIPTLDARTFASNKGINDFNLLINRIIRNYDSWQSAISRTVASKDRKKVAALGQSVATDLGSIARQISVLKPHTSITFDQFAAKLKQLGLEAEFSKSNLTIDGAISTLKRQYGSTLNGLLAAYEKDKSLFTEEITLIGKQVKEVLSTGKVSVKSAKRRPSTSNHRLCAARIACLATVLGLMGLAVGIVVVTACIAAGTAGLIPVCLAIMGKWAPWVVAAVMACIALIC